MSFTRRLHRENTGTVKTLKEGKNTAVCVRKRDVQAQLKRELNGNMGEKWLGGGVMKLHLFPHLMPERLGEVGGVLALLQENGDQTSSKR